MVRKRQRWVGLALSSQQVTFGVPGKTQQSSPLEGRFSNPDFVLPKCPARLFCIVNPAYLRDLCDLAIALGLDRVQVLFFHPTKPIGIIGHNDMGQFLDALLMPLT